MLTPRTAVPEGSLIPGMFAVLRVKCCKPTSAHNNLIMINVGFLFQVQIKATTTLHLKGGHSP